MSVTGFKGFRDDFFTDICWTTPSLVIIIHSEDCFVRLVDLNFVVRDGLFRFQESGVIRTP